jgi:hypothetical protein
MEITTGKQQTDTIQELGTPTLTAEGSNISTMGTTTTTTTMLSSSSSKMPAWEEVSYNSISSLFNPQINQLN